MRNKIISTLSIIGVAALLAGCDTVGISPKPPSSTEAKLYQVETNFIPATVTVTNLVQHTNVVIVTNTIDGSVESTNVVTFTPTVNQFQTNAPVYTYHNNPAITDQIQALGTATGPFTAGIGTMVASGLVALYGLWGHLRSSKMKGVASNLADSVEGLRDFILTLPQGTKIDSAVTAWLQQHQVEAGVSKQILTLIDGNTSDPTVNGISKELQDMIDAVTNPPVAPKT